MCLQRDINQVFENHETKVENDFLFDLSETYGGLLKGISCKNISIFLVGVYFRMEV